MSLSACNIIFSRDVYFWYEGNMHKIKNLSIWPEFKADGIAFVNWFTNNSEIFWVETKIGSHTSDPYEKWGCVERGGSLHPKHMSWTVRHVPLLDPIYIYRRVLVKRSSIYKDDHKARLSQDNSHEQAMKGWPYERTSLCILKSEINSIKLANNK